MDELEKQLEHLDELRSDAKKVNEELPLVAPNDYRIPSNENDKTDELLQKRDDQEKNWTTETSEEQIQDDTPLFLRSNERIEKDDNIDKTDELLQKRDNQEKLWSINLQNSLIGKIANYAKDKILSTDKYIEEVEQTVRETDQVLGQREESNEPAQINLDNNELISNFPNQALGQIENEELFKLEREENVKKLNKNKGSIFTTILVLLTTITTGLIAAIMIIK